MRDVAGNDAAVALAGVPGTAGVRVDTIAPTGSIAQVGALGADRTLVYQLTMSEDVTGVDAGDFSLATTGNVSATIGSVTSVDAHTYRITLTSVKGEGLLALSLNASGSGIADIAGNALAANIAASPLSLSTLTRAVTSPSPFVPELIIEGPAFSMPVTPLIVLPAVSDHEFDVFPDFFAPRTIDSILAGPISTELPNDLPDDSGNAVVIPPDVPYLGRDNAPDAPPLLASPDLGMQVIRNDQAFSIVLPRNTFEATEGAGRVTIEARLTNGRPLPNWIRFDPVTGTFSGQAPAGTSGEVDIQIIVRDGKGDRVSTVLHIEFRAARAALGRSSLDAQFAAASARSSQHAELLRTPRASGLERHFLAEQLTEWLS